MIACSQSDRRTQEDALRKQSDASRSNVSMLSELTDLGTKALSAQKDFMFVKVRASVADQDGLKQGKRNQALRVLRSNQAILASAIKQDELARNYFLKYVPQKSGLTADQKKQLMLCAAGQADLMKLYGQEDELYQRYVRTGDERVYYEIISSVDPKIGNVEQTLRQQVCNYHLQP
jgi:hypothetical protein